MLVKAVVATGLRCQCLRAPVAAFQHSAHSAPRGAVARDVIGIVPERNLNNGQPSLHAALFAAAAPQPGEHVVHVGAGVGYYTAILAELVGAEGRVTAIEFDAELAARAAVNLAQTLHVRALHGDGTRVVFDLADVIYVNAGHDAARGCLARGPEGEGKADPAIDGGRISTPRRSARGGVPDRATWLGIFRAPDLWGRDLSL